MVPYVQARPNVLAGMLNGRWEPIKLLSPKTLNIFYVLMVNTKQHMVKSDFCNEML